MDYLSYDPTTAGDQTDNTPGTRVTRKHKANGFAADPGRDY